MCTHTLPLTPSRPPQSVQYISAGDSHALALHQDGTVLSWGAGSFGRLGHGGGPSGKEMGRGDRALPTIIDKLKDIRVQQVRLRLRPSVSVKSVCKMVCACVCQWDSCGVWPPVPVRMFERVCACELTPPLSPPTQISAGHSHSAVVTRDGRCFIWGSGVSGKLGLGEITEAFECFAPLPTHLRFPIAGTKV